MDERMEAIMRKLTAMALSMMFILGSVIPVGAEETQIRIQYSYICREWKQYKSDTFNR